VYLWSPCFDPHYYKEFVYVKGRNDYQFKEFLIETVCPTINYESTADWIEHKKIFQTELNFRNFMLDNIHKDLVVLGIKDHLTSADFNPWLDTKPDMVIYLEDMFKYYHDKKFIVFTTMENLEKYITNPNVTLIPWGGDIVNHKESYEQLDVDIQKNFNSKYTFLSLNRGARHHRVVLVSLLYGLGLDAHGLISCMFKNNIDSVIERKNWKFDNNQQQIKELLIQGFANLQKSELKLNDDKETSGNPTNANVSNFKSSLINYYEQIFVEIITETSCTEQAFNLTEKTLHSIYGRCFPILISSPGIVKFLREIGMDVFDDIVDHSYDLIDNPVDRIYSAITKNIGLLTNNNRTKQLWQDNEHRFIKNIDFAKTTMYNFYTDRTIKKFHDAIERNL
jgi:hypothetical protein